MRRSLVYFIAALISLIPVSASSAHLLQFEAEAADSFELYSPNAERIEAAEGINDFGYLLKTKDYGVKISSAIGSIYLDKDSVFLFADSSPIKLFLINGKANIVLDEDYPSPISVYTPTTVVKLGSKGEYALISTADNEEFYNLSDSTAEAYDAVSGKKLIAGPMTVINYLDNGICEEVTEDAYHSISVINDVLFSVPVPARPVVAAYADLVSTVPASPVVFIKETSLSDRIPQIPELKAVKTELIARVPEKNLFSVTSVSSISSMIPEKTSLEAKAELITKPVLIKGRFNERIQVLDIQPRIQEKEPEPATPAEAIAEKTAEEEPQTLPVILEKEPEPATPAEAIAEPALEAASIEMAPAAAEPAAITASKPQNTASRITGTAKKSLTADFMFSTRAYTDSETNEQKLEFSFLPFIRYGSFALTLNLDPVHILSYTENESALDWARYSIAFLENMHFRSLDEHFSIIIDRETDAYGDSVGLYSGVNHLSDGKNERLSLSMNIRYPFFGMRIYANDLLLNTERKAVSGVDMDFRFSDSVPVGMTFGLLASSDISRFKENLMLYPEFSFYLPFYSKGADYVRMKAGISLALQPYEIADYSIEKSGYLISGVLPMKFGAFTAEPGIHYTNGALHYNSVDSTNYTPVAVPDTSLLTIASRFGYDGRYAGGNANVFFDVALNSMTMVRENSFIDVSAYIKAYSVMISGGMNVQDFTTAESYSTGKANFYAGIDFDFPSVTTYVKAGISDLKNKSFFLTYGASASFFSSDSSARISKKKDKKQPIHLDFITGYSYKFSEDKATYLIKPVVRLGNDDYCLSLRAPIELSFNSDREFILEGQNGKKWWDFGADEIEPSRKLYRAITDSFALIDEIKLGTEDIIAFLAADRTYRKNGSLFTAFGADDVLSLRTGFNFTNLSLGLFVDDLESPHIGEFSIGIMPLGKDSLSIGLRVPGEVLFKDLKNFNMNYYPEFRLDLPMFRKQFTLSVLAIGHVGVEYIDGMPSKTAVIYDFANNRFSSAMLGGEIALDFANASISVQGGYRIGSLTPDMYSRFTSLYNEIPTPVTDISPLADSNGYYGKVSSELRFSRFSLELAYSAANVLDLIKDYKTANDVFSTKIGIDFNEALAFYASLDRRGFARLFSLEDKFLDIMKDKNTIFGIGLDFNYGILNLNAEFATALTKSGYSTSNPYINTNPVYTGTTTTSLSVTTRIHF